MCLAERLKRAATGRTTQPPLRPSPTNHTPCAIVVELCYTRSGSLITHYSTALLSPVLKFLVCSGPISGRPAESNREQPTDLLSPAVAACCTLFKCYILFGTASHRLPQWERTLPVPALVSISVSDNLGRGYTVRGQKYSGPCLGPGPPPWPERRLESAPYLDMCFTHGT